jgi:hypothetical protein
MAKIVKPKTENQRMEGNASIFLAGSIEMGVAEDWQSRVEATLIYDDVTIYNPRRDSWDSSWVQRESNPEFRYQVNWELDKLREADIIFLYLSPNTKSPISLLELGIHSEDHPSKLIVCCPDGFWRKGNVEIICSRNGIPLFDNLDLAIASLQSRIHNI